MPFYREVERLDWRWVGRVRGRHHIKLKQHWRSRKQVFARVTLTSTALGIGEWVRSNPPRAAFVLVRVRPGSRKQRAYSRLFLARLLLTLEFPLILCK
ncbi:hypothetical protein [uncultured Thiohalocapsa sp.]|uniref:hypothetical protein n=1 Tax=uncultured Thiohalocapsa sp. TaxID=768990 RepID=UPI0025F598EA|nr:hypothetical protein [uncultured Thiohalocapsa sp.]